MNSEEREKLRRLVDRETRERLMIRVSHRYCIECGQLAHKGQCEEIDLLGPSGSKAA